ncbi:MAG: hypothetical protein K6A30_05870 [Lachnospiraceae bacterium]|nr:hypothetical protein [Lachnospiraceae bacterium]
MLQSILGIVLLLVYGAFLLLTQKVPIHAMVMAVIEFIMVILFGVAVYFQWMEGHGRIKWILMVLFAFIALMSIARGVQLVMKYKKEKRTQ